MSPDPEILAVLETLARSAPAAGRPPLIGLSGAQGAGKTTLAAAAARDLGAAVLSLDDVYLTQAERRALGQDVHPLLATRGPPGTHDLGLLTRTLGGLIAAGPSDVTVLPAFDKLADDRRPRADWPLFRGRPAFILVEGWCLGALPARPADLIRPLNALEAQEDPGGAWRRWVNDQLAGPYAALWDRFDGLLHLRAPGFEVVQGWREQQEAGLLSAPLSPERSADIGRFIQHFERITRQMLAGACRPGVVASLDANRRLTGLVWPDGESRYRQGHGRSGASSGDPGPGRGGGDLSGQRGHLADSRGAAHPPGLDAGAGRRPGGDDHRPGSGTRRRSVDP